MKRQLLFVLAFTLMGCENNSSNNKAEIKVDSLRIGNATSTKRTDSLIVIVDSLKEELNYWFDPERDGEMFREFGINNPDKFIENSLRGKPELIPLKAVLGGTMRFGKIQILSSKWLIADFDDGHIQGKGIYLYKFNNGGKIGFHLFDSCEQ